MTKNRLIPALSALTVILALAVNLVLHGGTSGVLALLQDLLLLSGVVGLLHGLLLRRIRTASQVFEQMGEPHRIDLRIRLDDSSGDLLGRLMKGVNTGIARADGAIAAITASAARLIPMSKELAETYTAVSKAASVQNEHSQTVTDEMEEVLDAANQVSAQAAEISQAVIQGRAHADDSKRVMEHTVQSMRQLAERIGQADQELAVLSQESERIGAIIDVISAVADQTNLLALNATIEAARAGEQGRGFAVVADEVRTLAARTQQSTHEIREMVGRIQGNTRRVVETMRLGSEATEQTAGQTEESRRRLDDIVQAVNRIGSVAEAIAAASDQQLRTTENARSSVTAMMELNGSAIAQATDHGVDTDDLIKLAQSLREKLDQFLLTECRWNESARGERRSV